MTAPRLIIGLTGAAGSGKSTVASILLNNHGFAHTRLAGPLKGMLHVLGLTWEEIDGAGKERPCALLGGKTPRHAMQTLGTEWGRELIDGDLWLRAWVRSIESIPGPIVCDDVRFPNEAAAIQAAGGVLVGVVGRAAPLPTDHVSEAGGIEVDEFLCNTGDLAELETRVAVLVRRRGWAG